MSNFNINPALLKRSAEGLFNGNKVKLYPETFNPKHMFNLRASITGEILSGKDKGKLTTVYLDKFTPINGFSLIIKGVKVI